MDMTYYFSVSENNVTVDKLDYMGKNPVLRWRSILLLKIKFIMESTVWPKVLPLKRLLFLRKPRNIIT